MQKPKPIDETAARMGKALYHARTSVHMPVDEACHLLHIMPDELIQYERGCIKFPQDVLEYMFMMGYKMIRARTLEKKYHQQRQVYRKLKQIMTEGV